MGGYKVIKEWIINLAVNEYSIHTVYASLIECKLFTCANSVTQGFMCEQDRVDQVAETLAYLAGMRVCVRA